MTRFLTSEEFIKNVMLYRFYYYASFNYLLFKSMQNYLIDKTFDDVENGLNAYFTYKLVNFYER